MTPHMQPPENQDSANINHLQSYLEYYKTISNPGYAVLVTGPWGSGKTFQVKEILSPSEYLYISLFGTQTTEEIYSAVYAKMFPMKAASKRIAASTDGAGAGPINLGGIVSGVANAILKEQVDAKRILIFDDLERSMIDTSDLLGIFNKYIEHHECRVIVIAHDKKITNTFKDIKEKVFGQTIEITPQTSKALDNFTASIANTESKKLISKFKKNILYIFDQSATLSLRILKHSLEDLARLISKLSDKHRSNEAAMEELLSFFLALSLEVRSGRIHEKDLKERSKAIIGTHIRASKSKPGEDVRAIYEADRRYLNIDLGNLILKDEALINLLIKGIYSESDIRNCLNETLYFSDPKDLPAWMVFIKFDEISDADSMAAVETLKQQFSSRSISDPGTLLHLFSLRFLFASIGLIPTDHPAIEVECKEYLDDLLDQNKIPPYLGIESQWGDDFKRSHNGYGFWVEKSYETHFNNIFNYLRETQQKSAKKQHPEYTKEILYLIEHDGAGFANKICPTFNGDNIFANIDVLASIPPIDFVQAWMGSVPANWRYISKGLEHRYDGGQLFGALKNEKSWLIELIELIDREHDKAKLIRKKRLQRIIPDILRQAVHS